MNAKKRSWIDLVWDFFASLKLTIFLLIMLAATSIIGTLIQQNRTSEEYLQVYGEKVYRLFDMLQVFDMYHSWWFLSLLGAISLNLLTCSFKRLPRVWKAVAVPVTEADEGLFQTLSNSRQLRVDLPAEEVGRRLEQLLSARFARPLVTRKAGRLYLFAQKGGWSRFGVYATHLSILLIFIGAIIGNLWGFKAYVNIEEGTSTSRVWPAGSREPIDLGFAVRCDDFNVSYYDGSDRPREFMSILDVIDGGREVISDRKIIVNDPLSYNGITFYQSSYGQAGSPQLKMRVKVRATGEALDLTVAEGAHVPLPGGGSFAVSGYSPSYGDFGPAVEMHVNTPDGQHGKPFVVLQRFPDFDEKRGGDFSFALVDFQEKMYTGLQVKKDPGVWVVWFGCLLMVMGSIVAFGFSHRRLWATIEAGSSHSLVHFGGSAHRNQPAFTLFFDELSQRLDETLEGETSSATLETLS
ncbi:MAG: hypothetical protein A2X84_01920 [Desulfuromonadaceae bacterium GWC2_58_13]|nr:MAG: hypothetical protein A2X84_01920 [Desulfuromonadaceae bacterium GWC2_58_13]